MLSVNEIPEDYVMVDDSVNELPEDYVMVCQPCAQDDPGSGIGKPAGVSSR